LAKAILSCIISSSIVARRASDMAVLSCPVGCLFGALLMSVVVSDATAGAVDGTLTMWTDGRRTIEGSSCRFADPRGGGLDGPGAHSPYISRESYCAVSADLYDGGHACGRCYRLIYGGDEGLHGTPAGKSGSLIIKVVDSGAGGTDHFDCHLTAYTSLTSTAPGMFPIRFEPATCMTAGRYPDVTVLQGGNPWSIIALFSDLASPVSSAYITVDGQRFKMRQGSSAGWAGDVFLQGGAKRDHTVVSFYVKLADGTSANLVNCFSHWPLTVGDSCDFDRLQLSSSPMDLSMAAEMDLSMAPEIDSANQTRPIDQMVPNANVSNSTVTPQALSRGFLAPTIP